MTIFSIVFGAVALILFLGAVVSGGMILIAAVEILLNRGNTGSRSDPDREERENAWSVLWALFLIALALSLILSGIALIAICVEKGQEWWGFPLVGGLILVAGGLFAGYWIGYFAISTKLETSEPNPTNEGVVSRSDADSRRWHRQAAHNSLWGLCLIGLVVGLLLVAGAGFRYKHVSNAEKQASKNK